MAVGEVCSTEVPDPTVPVLVVRDGSACGKEVYATTVKRRIQSWVDTTGA